MKKRVLLAALITLLMGGFLTFNTTKAYGGFWEEFWGRFGANTKTSAVEQAFNPDAVNARLRLNSLMKEHTIMSAASLSAVYAGIEAERLEDLMDANSNQIASIMESAYGANMRDTFAQLWNAHMVEYRNYTQAVKDSDEPATNTAKVNLEKIASDLGTLFDENGQNQTKAIVELLMNEHINGTLSVVDAIAKADGNEASNMLKAGYDQSGAFADALTRGMLLDNPDAFE